MPRTKRVFRRGLGEGSGGQRARSPPRGPPPPLLPFDPPAEGDDRYRDRNKGKEVVVGVKGESEQFVPEKLGKAARRKAFQLLGYKQTYLRPKRGPRSTVGPANRSINLFAQFGGLMWPWKVNSTTPSIGHKEPILALGAEYPIDSYAIQTKVKNLSYHISSFRRTRRDGNCFYRCFIFAYLERIYDAQDENEVNHILACVEKYQQEYVSLGGEKKYFMDLAEALVELVNEIPEGKEINMIYTAEDLYEKCQEETEMNFSEKHRLIASVEICKKREIYSPFLGELKDRTVQEFCEEEIIPMGMEATQVQVKALSNAFCVPVNIVYINSAALRRGTVQPNFRFYYPGELSNGGQGSSSHRRNPVTILYRPGRYDILYLK